jgi:hypothetical protein
MRDVPTGTLLELLRQFDSDELRRGNQFEKMVKWWLQNDPARSRNIKTVWLWDEWPDRPGLAIGVEAPLADSSPHQSTHPTTAVQTCLVLCLRPDTSRQVSQSGQQLESSPAIPTPRNAPCHEVFEPQRQVMG